MPDVFTPQEVHSLNEYQNHGVMHPFTCGGGQRTEHPDGEGILMATTQGWVCPYCDYRQDWAHESMKNGNWKKTGAYRAMQMLHERARVYAELDEEMMRALRDLSGEVLKLRLEPASEAMGAAMFKAGTVLGKLDKHGLLPEAEDQGNRGRVPGVSGQVAVEAVDEYDWQLIAPGNLPEFDDLLLQDMNPPHGAWAVTNKHYLRQVSYEEWMEHGYRWFAKMRMPTRYDEAYARRGDFVLPKMGANASDEQSA